MRGADVETGGFDIVQVVRYLCREEKRPYRSVLISVMGRMDVLSAST
jgi:hypothetical protein